jgi:hypothetical protein
MKQFLLLILLITSTTAFSQNSNKVVKMRLDSVVFNNGIFTYSKILFFYDKSGNETQRHRYDYDENNNLEGSYKCEYTYDANNNLIMQIERNECHAEKDKYMYDINKNLIMQIGYYPKNGYNNWKKDYKVKIMYDTNGNSTMLIGYDKTYDGKKKFKIETVYDTNKKEIKAVHYDKKRTIWENSEKTEYEYDNNGNQTKNIRYSWTKNNWKEGTKHEYVYNNGKETAFINYHWHNNDWKATSKYENTYDTNGNKITNVFYYNTFDEWWISSKTEYVYDLFYPVENLIIPHSFFENNNINYMLIEEKYSEGVNTYTKKYYYSPQTIEEKSNQQINK